jgi:ribosomal protein S8
MNKHVFNLIKAIDYGYSKNESYVNVLVSRSALSFCLFLRDNVGLISHYEIVKNEMFIWKTHLRVYLTMCPLNSKNLANTMLETGVKAEAITQLAKPYQLLIVKSFMRPSYISYIALLKVKNLGVIYLLSTTFGYLTSQQAINLKLGGSIICVLYI